MPKLILVTAIAALVAVLVAAVSGCDDSGGAGVGGTASAAPLAAPDIALTQLYTPVDIDVLANDSDPNGGTLSIQSYTQPVGVPGGVVDQVDSLLRYTPNPGFSGVDSFIYTIVNDFGKTAAATVTVTVEGFGWSVVSTQVVESLSGSSAIAIADFNNDGRPDLAIACYRTQEIAVHFNTTPNDGDTPTFAAPNSYDAGVIMIDIKAVDVNGNGLPDLVAGSLSTLEVRLNDPANPGTFLAPQTFGFGTLTSVGDIAVGDLDGDGRSDLAVILMNPLLEVAIMRNETVQGSTTASFVLVDSYPLIDINNGESGYVGIALGDLNGDGKPDLVTSWQGSNEIWVRMNQSSVGLIAFSAAHIVAVPSSYVPSIAIGDLDGDGKPDIVFGGSNGGGVGVILNLTAPGSGSPDFAAVEFFPAWGGRGVALADLSGNGKLDIVVSDDCSVFLNESTPGNLVLGPIANYQGTGVSLHIYVADLNGDGIPDIVMPNDADPSWAPFDPEMILINVGRR